MLKVMRRTAQAEKQAAKRATKEKRHEEKKSRILLQKHLTILQTQIRGQRKDAKLARRQAWDMGPLAPNRDSAFMPTPRATYWGTINPERAKLDPDLSDEDREARCAWAGGSKWLCLKEGDRIIVMEGPHKGEIGPIQAIYKKHGALEAEGVAIANMHMPDYLVGEDAPVVNTAESRIPIDAVRLVHPITDPKTGVTRDVIIRELKPTNFFYDRPTREMEWSRVVPGLNIEIPWPRKPEPEYEDTPADTLRIDVEEKTFVPMLLKPPMPEAVIDELRNRFSKFRTRHSSEYLAKKQAEEEAERARRQMIESMRTPLQEFHIRQKALRKARGQPVLTDEMLEKIGEIMTKNKRRALEAAGATEVTSTMTTTPRPGLLDGVATSSETISENRPPPP